MKSLLTFATLAMLSVAVNAQTNEWGLLSKEYKRLANEINNTQTSLVSSLCYTGAIPAGKYIGRFSPVDIQTGRVDRMITDEHGRILLIGKTNWCDRIPAWDHEEAVKDLAAGGVICRVVGHSWDEGQQGRRPDQIINDQYNNIKRRTCRICGKCESKTEGSWK